jgi:alpha-amylase
MGQTTGGAGFRLDAIKHMDRKFLLQWVSVYKKLQSHFLSYSWRATMQINQVRMRDGRSRTFMVAEYWTPMSACSCLHVTGRH